MASVEWDTYPETETNNQRWVTTKGNAQLVVTKFTDGSAEWYTWRNNYTGEQYEFGVTDTMLEAMSQALRSV